MVTLLLPTMVPVRPVPGNGEQAVFLSTIRTDYDFPDRVAMFVVLLPAFTRALVGPGELTYREPVRTQITQPCMFVASQSMSMVMLSGQCE
jgi:hypothetical protein